MAERTLIVIKPDGVQRHLIGQIISRFEKKGFKLVAAKFMQISQEQTRKLYAVHKGADFFEDLVKSLCSAPVLLTVWEGSGVINMARRIIGATFGYEAEPGTIRGDFCCSQRYNLVHSADSPESAKEEIELFFKPEELLDYKFPDAEFLYGKND
jgi:nucleoside-diphosphate kinase